MPALDSRRGGSGWHEVTLQQRRDASQVRASCPPPPPPLFHVLSQTPRWQRLGCCRHNTVLAALTCQGQHSDDAAAMHGLQAHYIAAGGASAIADLEPRNSDEFPRMGGSTPLPNERGRPRGGSSDGTGRTPGERLRLYSADINAAFRLGWKCNVATLHRLLALCNCAPASWHTGSGQSYGRPKALRCCQ